MDSRAEPAASSNKTAGWVRAPEGGEDPMVGQSADALSAACLTEVEWSMPDANKLATRQQELHRQVNNRSEFRRSVIEESRGWACTPGSLLPFL